MADIASAIGRTDDAERYTNRLARNRKAYHVKFWNQRGDKIPKCCYDAGSDTSNIFALHIGAVPAEHVNQTVSALVASLRSWNGSSSSSGGSGGGGSSRIVEDVDWRAGHREIASSAAPPWGAGAHMDCGIFGTTYIFDVLHKHGQDAVALEVLTETSFPSLGRMIEQGATTLWEGWDGTRTTIGSSTSRNHIMFGGGVARYLLASVGGIAPQAAGWSRLLLGPTAAAARLLSHGGAERQTPSGTAMVLWRRNDEGSLSVDVTVPSLASATVRMPLLDTLVVVTYHGGVDGSACAVECSSSRAEATALVGDGCEGRFLAAPSCSLTETGERILFFEVGTGEHSFQAARAT